ncbi:MAG: hypothetical protein JWP94_3302 [Mucilaginibacter sp.]|nr:hypothetical protein [Mucilaginibacter sp.]
MEYAIYCSSRRKNESEQTLQDFPYFYLSAHQIIFNPEPVGQ